MKILIKPVANTSEETEFFETLEQFKDWYCSTYQAGSFGQIPLVDFSFSLEGLTALTLCRRGPYQVELLTGRPGHWYEITIAPGQVSHISYQGGHVLMKDNQDTAREWDPEQYIQSHSLTNAREDSPSWSGEGGLFLEGNHFQFSFGPQGGVILAYTRRDVPYKSCLENVRLIENTP